MGLVLSVSYSETTGELLGWSYSDLSRLDLFDLDLFHLGWCYQGMCLDLWHSAS